MILTLKPLVHAPQSPEKLQATLAEMGAAVDRERAAATEAEKRLRGVHARSEQLTKVRVPPLHDQRIAFCSVLRHALYRLSSHR